MGIKYDKKDKKVKIKEMHGGHNEDREDPGWICQCQTCNGYGYITIGVTVPTQCRQCFESSP